jgi:hypothetical protein
MAAYIRQLIGCMSTDRLGVHVRAAVRQNLPALPA